MFDNSPLLRHPLCLTTFLSTYIFERKSKQYFKWVNFLKNCWSRTEKVGVTTLLFRRLNVDDCYISSTEYSELKLLFDSIFTKTWLVYSVHCVVTDVYSVHCVVADAWINRKMSDVTTFVSIATVFPEGHL
jgi:hypothetical protein